MIYNIIWSPDAITTFEERLEYLNIHWTDREVKNFKVRVTEYLETLEQAPFIGRKPGKFKNIYIGLIIKQVSLIYRVNKKSKVIELVLFVDNRQNPTKIKRYKS